MLIPAAFGALSWREKQEMRSAVQRVSTSLDIPYPTPVLKELQSGGAKLVKHPCCQWKDTWYPLNDKRSLNSDQRQITAGT